MDNNFTNRDAAQTVLYEHDENTNSKRVNVVNIHGLKEGIIESLKGLKLNLHDDFQSMKPAVQEPHYKFIPNEPQVINVPTIIKEIQVTEIPKIVTQVQTIEIPVIIKEIEIKYIDRPIITESVKVIEIEKPVYITEFKELPKGIFLSLGIFLTLNLGLLITLIRK